ncbi:bifunctional purine biosynthesis protein PurH [bacterium BMS3Abin04]|nr:bifunctional purine biosynthesis protein PurH [bacterium BMS3Abin04]
MKKFALLSVSDKLNIVEFAKELKSFGYGLLATGNTAALLKNNNIECTQISDYTGFPEIFSGRVKSLHPKIFGGILLRRENNDDLKEASSNNIMPIDVVCVNLYPFHKVVNDKGVNLLEKLENIDIGGPSLIRAAAKNYKSVSVLTSPSQYDKFLSKLKSDNLSEAVRIELASAAFAHTAQYDAMIADFFEHEFNLPRKELRVNSKLSKSLRYGENPHQKAFLFGDFDKYFEILHGKELSYNNIVDLTSAVDLIADLPKNSCAIVKHTNPCGAATSQDTYSSYVEALSCDPVSAFGGIASFNTTIDEKTAKKLNEIFLEIICAPNFSEDALTILRKKKNRRLVKILKSANKEEPVVKSINGGFLVQDKDNSFLSDDNLRIVTEKTYTEEEFKDLKFAWTICKYTKSNAIVFVKKQKAIGVGAGQMSRVEAAKLAAQRAKEYGHSLKGAVAASDAFFPFADGVEIIASEGITSIIQPGGSIRDEEVIAEANKHNISMVFSGIRNFKH